MFQVFMITFSIMLESILTKNGRALLCIASSFLLSNASLEASNASLEASNTSLETVRIRHNWTLAEDQALIKAVKKFGTNNWTPIAVCVGNRAARQCRERWKNKLNPAISNAQWSGREKQRLAIIAPRLRYQWALISVLFPSRTDRQCRECWEDELNPGINKEPWTAEEDQILMATRQTGARWIEIAARLQGRPPKQCRRRLIFLITHLLKVSYRRARILLAHSPENLFTRLQAASHRLVLEVEADSDPATVTGEEGQQAEALHYPALEAEETGAVFPADLQPVPRPALPLVPRLGLAADRDGTPDALASAVGHANPRPSRRRQRKAVLVVPTRVAVYGDGVAATGEEGQQAEALHYPALEAEEAGAVFPADLQLKPLRSYLLGADGNGTPAAATDEEGQQAEALHYPALEAEEAGTAFPADLQLKPLRSYLLGADRDGTPGAVAGAAAHRPARPFAVDIRTLLNH
jgi:hypothetical protein